MDISADPLGPAPVSQSTNPPNSTVDDTPFAGAHSEAAEPDECKWTSAAAARAELCAKQMRERLAHKLSAWEKPTVLRGEAWIAAPIIDPPLGYVPSELLLTWVHFNPCRPIVSNLWYAELPGGKEGLIRFFKTDHLQTREAVFGLIPGSFNLAAIADAATALFAANGHDLFHMFQGLPSSVAHSQNWTFDPTAPYFGPELTKELFRFIAIRCWPTTAVRVLCEHLKRYRSPFDRAAAALRYRDRVAAGFERAEISDFDETSYSEWFDLVTRPEHVETERSCFSNAAAGARRLYQKYLASEEMKKGAAEYDPQ